MSQQQADLGFPVGDIRLHQHQKQPQAEQEHSGKQVLCRQKIVVENLRRPEGRECQSCQTRGSARQHGRAAPEEKAGRNRAGDIEHLPHPDRVAEHAHHQRQDAAVAVDVGKHGHIVAVARTILQQGAPVDELGNLIVGFVVRLRRHGKMANVHHPHPEGHQQNDRPQTPFQG